MGVTATGRSLLPVLAHDGPGKEEAICEWDWEGGRRIYAIRTAQFRLVYYGHKEGGELYDHGTDPGEMLNVYGDGAYAAIRSELVERLFDRVKAFAAKATTRTDQEVLFQTRYTVKELVHKRCVPWSDIAKLAGAGLAKMGDGNR